jgi:hypothetical protein
VKLTASFCCIIYTLELNKNLNKDIEMFILSNITSKREVLNEEYDKFRDLLKLGHIEKPGFFIKKELLSDIFTDIKWNIAREVHKFIPCTILYEHKVDLPHIYSAQTNISGNSSKSRNFWVSIGVEISRCDFTQDLSGCISWDENFRNGAFVYLHSIYNKIFADDIIRDLSPYLVANSVNDSLAENLQRFSNKIHNMSEVNLMKRLSQGARIAVDSFYYIRFIDEYESSYRTLSKYRSIMEDKVPFITQRYQGIRSELSKTKNLYNSIMTLFCTIVDNKNVQENYAMLGWSLFVAFVSFFVALASLIVSVIGMMQGKC